MKKILNFKDFFPEIEFGHFFCPFFENEKKSLKKLTFTA